MKIDFAGINASLLARSREFLSSLFPAGRIEGHEFKIGNIRGDPGRSLSINLNTGVGADFSAKEGEETYSDLIAIYAAHHGIGMGEAAKELGGDGPRPTQAPKRNDHDVPRETSPSKSAIIPVPADAPPPPDTLSLQRDGAWRDFPIAARWEYTLPNGDLVGYACRVNFEGGGKDVIPIIYATKGRERAKWRQGSFPKPRPLYNATKFLPGNRVIIVEGEKCVEHVKALNTSRHPVCWPGGGKAVKFADWSVLAGCDVLLFPDHDQPGREAMAEVAARLLPIAAKVSVIDTAALELPEGWDIADTDWTREQFNEWARPLIREIPKEIPSKNAANAAPDGKSLTRGSPRVNAEGEPATGGVLIGGENAFVNWGALALDLDSKGVPYPNVYNFMGVLNRHPRIKARIWFDEFHNRIFQTLLQEEPSELTDRVDIELTAWLQGALRIPKASKFTVRDAITGVAMQNVRNEPVEWLNQIPWDGTERLPMMLVDGWGAKDSQYVRDIGRCFIVGMVARVFQPGCQLDYLPVFEGTQGFGKSKALRLLGGKWHTEMHEEVGSKDFYQGLTGKMIVEFSEMHTLTGTRKDVRRIKGILSNPVDRYRESYGFRSADHRRRNVFAATCNPEDWNGDPTGARRFWPIVVGDINFDYIAANREQLFAEALHRYRAGESWWDFDEAAAQVEQEARKTEDPWTETIAEYARLEEFIRVDVVLENVLGLPVQARDMAAAKRAGQVLRSLGYVKKNLMRAGRQEKVWTLPVERGRAVDTGRPEF
jgi:hypothetical protein